MQLFFALALYPDTIYSTSIAFWISSFYSSHTPEAYKTSAGEPAVIGKKKGLCVPEGVQVILCPKTDIGWCLKITRG